MLIPLIVLVLSAPAALGFERPERGSAERKAMLDAIRPIAEWNLGPPVEFVVQDLMVEGSYGWASLLAQRPGGAAIALDQAPMVARDDMAEDLIDRVDGHPTLQVMLQKSGETWVAVNWAIGATDVWYAGEPYCAQWGWAIRAVTGPGPCP
ncbi:hypothetical protein [Gemmobacter serpentinus]|uniref:hypothetical protein n=1 Tax=Gemmobacter serpentinus TaxID=2652247 RepID=UPI00124E9CA1|nr:hypothetical protein [Gemmobacter serpentinus]